MSIYVIDYVDIGERNKTCFLKTGEYGTRMVTELIRVLLKEAKEANLCKGILCVLPTEGDINWLNGETIDVSDFIEDVRRYTYSIDLTSITDKDIEAKIRELLHMHPLKT